MEAGPVTAVGGTAIFSFIGVDPAFALLLSIPILANFALVVGQI